MGEKCRFGLIESDELFFKSHYILGLKKLEKFSPVFLAPGPLL